MIPNGPDVRLRSLVRQARAGDLTAALQLAHELRRTGELPETGRAHGPSYGLTSLVPHDSYLVTLGPEGEPPDVCIVPVSPTAIHVQVGPLGRHRAAPVGMEDLVRVSGPVSHEAAQRGHQGRQYSIVYRPCANLRGPTYTSPGGRVYEMAGSDTFLFEDELDARFRTPGHRPVYYHFVGVKRRPRGYEQILRDVRVRLHIPVTRLVNDWATENAEALEQPAAGVATTGLARLLRSLEAAEQHAADARERVANEAIRVSEVLGL